MRGVRIQSIVTELGGEKIDVIEWNADPALYIQKALSPARVLTVQPEEDPKEGKLALVVVPDDQLSLAIGREGQNARLAAKLTAWRIDIKGSTEAARDTLSQVEANPELKEKLAGTALLVQTALQRHAEQPLPWNTEELQQIKLLLEGVNHFVNARKRAEREKARAIVQPEAPKVVAVLEPWPAETTRQETINAYRARIPAKAYDTAIGELGLTPRVLEHVERAGITTVGQIHERLATGDEAMLALEGIGPKGLSHIKQMIDEKGLGLLPIVTEAAPVVEQPIEAAPSAGPIETVEQAEGTAAAVIEQPMAEGAALPGEITPEGVAPQPAVTAVGEAVVPVAVGAVAAEEVEDEDDLERKGGKKKVKRKDRTLVFDETRGVVVAKKQHKAGRDKDFLNVDEEEI